MSDQEQNSLDQLFKKAAQDYRVVPDKDLWKKIESRKATKKGMSFAILRAASVAILMGVSSIVYFQKNEASLMRVEPLQEKSIDIKEHKKREIIDLNTPKATQEEEKSVERTSIKKTENRKQNTKKTEEVQIVSAAFSPDYEIDDEYLQDAELIKPERLILTPEVKVRVKYRNQKEVSRNQNKEEKRNAKEKVMTYASDQFQKIKNGEPVHLPDFPEGSPQISINIDKIQNFLLN